MALLAQRIGSALWGRRRPVGIFDARDEPECIVLPAVGPVPSGRPPVRIFLGTELAQHRAERAFLWSVEQARDPARAYEIYLMKELAGFDRRFWLTGFTNYRFAIPEFAGGSGLAIYNDVDQIYFADPALLFDLDMGGRGYLSVSESDTSVMLIDCARMAPLWNRDAARRRRKNGLLKAARTTPGLWGPLAADWNARDGEYVAGRSRLLHYTALHTQPWRPFPRQFAYQASNEAGLWHDLERTANEAGYEVFTASRPTRHFLVMSDWLRAARAAASTIPPPAHVGAYLRSEFSGPFEATATERTLQVGIDAGQRLADGLAFVALSEVSRPAWPARRHERVLCVDTLEYLPDEDIPWVVARLFEAADRSFCAAVSEPGLPRPIGAPRKLTARSRGVAWWTELIERIARRYPHVHWKFIVHDAGRGRTLRVHEGGNLGRMPSVWVLNDHKAGHAVQGQGLVEALGWPSEIKQLEFAPHVYLHRGLARIFGMTEATGFGLARRTRRTLGPPWPDVIVATGWKPARVARWISRLSKGRTRLVLLGRKGSPVADGQDILVSCLHFRLPQHPSRIEVTLPPNRVTGNRLQEAAKQWRSEYGDPPHPRVALLVGGSTECQRFGPDAALKLGREVRAFAEARDARVFAITSPRTGIEPTAALRTGLGPAAVVHEWRRGERNNPYLGFLAACDMLIVTGDSESMLSEAVATGKPVLIYPLPSRRPSWRHRAASWVLARADARPANRRGTTRPQQGLEYICARLIERNIVQPPRDFHALYRALETSGRAVLFDVRRSVPEAAEPDAANETFALARAVEARLPFSPDSRRLARRAAQAWGTAGDKALQSLR